jgi:hypothetical protein
MERKRGSMDKKNNIMKIIVYKRKKWRERWDQ